MNAWHAACRGCVGTMCLALLPWMLQAQPTADAVDTQQYLALIEREQDTSGLTSPALIEPLTTLGQYYFAQEDYDRAFEAFAGARQILRVNNGFDTLQEWPLMAHLVRTEEARGRFEQAWELEQALLARVEQNAGKIETLPIFRELAQKRLAIWDRYRYGEIAPQIVLGCYYDRQRYVAAMGGRLMFTEARPKSPESCTAGDRGTVRLALLIEARSYQMHALEALLQNGDYASDDMWTAFIDMLRTSYAIMLRARGIGDPPLAGMMTRLLSYEPVDAAGRIRRAEVLVQLADMNVVRAREIDRYIGYDAVAEQYRQARDAFQREGFTQAELDTIFAPPQPITLPAFASNALATTARVDASGYIDVRFEITHKGKARRIDVVGASAGITRPQSRGLEQLIFRNTFRPRLLDEELAAATPVSLRYYLDAATPVEQACIDEDTGEACEG